MSKETDSDEEILELQYKIILLGDGAVGKTSVAMRCTEDNFSNLYKQTIGLDFFLKRLVLPGDAQVTIQLWDIGGQSIGGKMLTNYIYGAQAVLLMYDVTNYASFQNLEDWYRLVRRTFDKGEMPYVALVGNKTDLNHLRTIKLAKHKQFAEENDLKSFFLSAKTGDQVNATFRQVAADLSGIELGKNDLDEQTPVLKAQIVNHEQNDPDVKSPDIRARKRQCNLQ